MESLYWPNTVQLTLSIQYPSELVLLLKRDALPAIEHLNITNEQIHTVFPLRRYIPVSNIHLCDYNLREIADGTRLRSLLLRYLSLSDIILLIGSLTMPLLEKLILIDLYDDNRIYPEPKKYFNIRRLTQLTPHLHSLETSNANIMFYEHLLGFVLKIIRQFHQLVYLILNKDGRYPAKEEIKTTFKEKLIATGHNQSFDCNNIRIEFSHLNELYIWL
ncbi:unnamed protein product [Rotaria sp. Silwood1]|nr:unnamed protein product [Rotaria sp. Silwood1]